MEPSDLIATDELSDSRTYMSRAQAPLTYVKTMNTDKTKI
jgi:hypothetical protein